MDDKEIHLDKILTVELYHNFPNTAVTYVEYNNLSDTPIVAYRFGTIPILPLTALNISCEFVFASSKPNGFRVFIIV